MESSGAKDDYIEREGRYSADRSEVEHVESGHMPGWAEEAPHAYWEAADAGERVSGRTGDCSGSWSSPCRRSSTKGSAGRWRSSSPDSSPMGSDCPTPWRSTGAGVRTHTATW